MPFNANFTGATLQADGKLKIAGTSVGDSAAIVVSLIHDMKVHTQNVDHPDDSPWTALFTPDETAFDHGDEVFVVGIATRAGHDPFVWQGGFALSLKSDVVKV